MKCWGCITCTRPDHEIEKLLNADAEADFFFYFGQDRKFNDAANSTPAKKSAAILCLDGNHEPV